MTSEQQNELDRIAGRHNGLLRVRDVVNYARDEETALHSCFEWDDGTAAEAYRLDQARDLIQVYVMVVEGSDEPVRAFVSLQSDRTNPGGGYRPLVLVMQDDERRAELLAQAMAEFHRWRDKYRQLKELGPIFTAAQKVRRKRKSA